MEDMCAANLSTLPLRVNEPQFQQFSADPRSGVSGERRALGSTFENAALTKRRYWTFLPKWELLP
jgi:hypothetical protein